MNIVNQKCTCGQFVICDTDSHCCIRKPLGTITGTDSQFTQQPQGEETYVPFDENAETPEEHEGELIKFPPGTVHATTTTDGLKTLPQPVRSEPDEFNEMIAREVKDGEWNVATVLSWCFAQEGVYPHDNIWMAMQRAVEKYVTIELTAFADKHKITQQPPSDGWSEERASLEWEIALLLSWISHQQKDTMFNEEKNRCLKEHDFEGATMARDQQRENKTSWNKLMEDANSVFTKYRNKSLPTNYEQSKAAK